MLKFKVQTIDVLIIKLLIVFLFLGTILSGNSQNSATSADFLSVSAKVAFIGNSLTMLNGGSDLVVMQEGGDWTYSVDPSHAILFYQYAKMWSDTIRKAGARPVLYMMWAWQSDSGEQIKKITDFQAALYDSAARLIHAKVIPIGRGYVNHLR